MSLNQRSRLTRVQCQKPFGNLCDWFKNVWPVLGADLPRGVGQEQSGRSTLEMLGVLVIIGVLSIGGIVGYRQAVNSYEVNSLLFFARQYASQIFMRKGIHYNNGQAVLPTPKELGFKPMEMGMYPTTDYLKKNGVELHLSFYNQNHCQIAADFLNTRCQLVSKGAMCRHVENAGIGSEDLERVVGCFDYVFYDN